MSTRPGSRGSYGSCSAYLVLLIQHSDEMFNAVLSMASQHDLVFAPEVGGS
jgi:hypothetical protein